MVLKNWRGLLVFLMLGVLLFLCATQGEKTEKERLSYADFWQMAENGKVHHVKIGDGENWQVQLQDGSQALTPNPRAVDGKERLLALGIEVQEEAASSGTMLGIALLFLLAIPLFQRSKSGAMGLQKYADVQADAKVPQVTFEDVAVSPETLQSMRDLVAFLQEPKRFSRYGARVPKGVMLYGPPGTGKTMLAKALAGEANAPFFAMSGADFVQVYVGVGASRIRELFKKARKAGGGVIFIDEIDAIGKKRDHGNDEREQTLNALLTEMSGFSDNEGIIVLAATNRLDTLDPALLREGRFDRRIEIGLPDCAQRRKILTVHARKKPLGSQVSLDDLAARTTLFSGAQLETLLNEAAIRAARRESESIEAEDIEKAYCAVTMGEERPHTLSPREKEITAYHEAGHAVIMKKMMKKARVTKITIIPSSRGAAGYAMSIQPDQVLYEKEDLLSMICAALGGRMAEEILLGAEHITTGASGDIKKAKEIAASMAGEWAMGETGEEKEDADRILRQASGLTRQCLLANRTLLTQLAQALLKKETLYEAEIQQLLS